MELTWIASKEAIMPPANITSLVIQFISRATDCKKKLYLQNADTENGQQFGIFFQDVIKYYA